MRRLDTAELRVQGTGALNPEEDAEDACSEVCVLGNGKEGVKCACGDLMDLKATGEGNTQTEDCD